MVKRYFPQALILMGLFFSLSFFELPPCYGAEETGTSSPQAESGSPPEAPTPEPQMNSTGKEGEEVESPEALFDEKEALAHYREGVRWYQKKNYKNAVFELEKAVEINPDYKEAYYLLGYAYYKVGKMEPSRDAFNQAYELDQKYSPRGLK